VYSTQKKQQGRWKTFATAVIHCLNQMSSKQIELFSKHIGQSDLFTV